MRRYLRLSPVGCLLFVSLLLTLPGPAIAQTATPTGSPSPARIVRTLVYHELTAFTAGPNDGGEEAPILSGDGRTITFARAPGTENPATPNRIFVMDANGSGERQIDSYTTRCFCGSLIDISADGRAIVSTDSMQLRIADASGTAGRQLLAIDSNEINAARLSGDDHVVFFRLRRDVTLVAPTPGRSLTRGMWAINADGSGLRQLVGPAQLATVLGVPVARIPVALDTGFGLAVSSDGSHVIFDAYHPRTGGLDEGLFAVNGDGTGLRELVGPLSAVAGAAISSDGATVGYAITDVAGKHQAGIIPFSGGGRRTLTTISIVASGDRVELSGDGRWLLLGSTGLLYRTDGSAIIPLAVRPCCSGDTAPLVGDGLFRATMDRAADRFLYLSGDAKGVRQLARLDLDPVDPGAVPRVTAVTIAPAAVPQGGGGSATLTARVSDAPASVAVRSAILLGPGVRGAPGDPDVSDPHVNAPLLVDDGTNGDRKAGDGVFTTNAVRTDCCAVPGPRMIRVLAEAVGTDGKRQAMAVDAAPFAVVAAGNPSATPAAVTPGGILLSAAGNTARLSGPIRSKPACFRKGQESQAIANIRQFAREHREVRRSVPGTALSPAFASWLGHSAAAHQQAASHLTKFGHVATSGSAGTMASRTGPAFRASNPTACPSASMST